MIQKSINNTVLGKTTQTEKKMATYLHQYFLKHQHIKFLISQKRGVHVIGRHYKIAYTGPSDLYQQNNFFCLFHN